MVMAREDRKEGGGMLPAAVRCDMMLHHSLRTRCVRKNGIGGDLKRATSVPLKLNVISFPALC